MDGSDSELTLTLEESLPTVSQYLETTSEEEFDLRELEFLLENFPNQINERNQNGMTPLILAVTHGHPVALDVLLKHQDVDVCAVDNQRLSALLYSIAFEEDDSFQALIESDKVDVNHVYETGMSALEYAMGTECVRLDYLQRLLEAGANCNVRDEQGYTVLHFLSFLTLPTFRKRNSFYESFSKEDLFKLQVDCAKLCLEKGLSPLDVDHNGKTPIHLCCRYGQAELLWMLLENLSGDERREALVRETNNHFAPWMYCCQPEYFYRNEYKWPGDRPSSLECAQILVDFGLRLDSADNHFGYAPLTYAILSSPTTNRQIRFAKMLLDNGASTTAVDFQGFTAYHYAIENNVTEVLDTMLSLDVGRGSEPQSFSDEESEDDEYEVNLDELVEYASRSFVAKYIEDECSPATAPSIECLRILVDYGGNLTFALGAILENMEHQAVAVLVRKLFDLGFQVKTARRVSLITKAVIEDNFTLVRFLLEKGANPITSFSQNLCKTRLLAERRTRDHLSPHRCVEFQSARHLLAAFASNDDCCVVCTICSREIPAYEKVKCCTEAACETYICQQCTYFKPTENKNNRRTSFSKLDEQFELAESKPQEITSHEAARRKGCPRMINLLNCSQTFVTKKLRKHRFSQYIDFFYSAGLRDYRHVKNLSLKHLQSLGIDSTVAQKKLLAVLQEQ